MFIDYFGEKNNHSLYAIATGTGYIHYKSPGLLDQGYNIVFSYYNKLNTGNKW